MWKTCSSWILHIDLWWLIPAGKEIFHVMSIKSCTEVLKGSYIWMQIHYFEYKNNYYTVAWFLPIRNLLFAHLNKMAPISLKYIVEKLVSDNVWVINLFFTILRFCFVLLSIFLTRNYETSLPWYFLVITIWKYQLTKVQCRSSTLLIHPGTYHHSLQKNVNKSIATEFAAGSPKKNLKNGVLINRIILKYILPIVAFVHLEFRT